MSAQTLSHGAPMIAPLSSENTTMRVNKLVLAAAVTAAMSVLIAGCGKETPSVPSSSGVVLGTQVDDSVITTKVKTALLADPDIKSFDLAVETSKGMVQLSGTVENQDQIDRALAVARGVDGVSAVENKISLKVAAADAAPASAVPASAVPASAVPADAAPSAAAPTGAAPVAETPTGSAPTATAPSEAAPAAAPAMK